MSRIPERYGQVSLETVAVAAFAALLWSVMATSAVFLSFGESGAVNPLLGCLPCALMTTWAARVFYRQDVRHAERMRQVAESNARFAQEMQVAWGNVHAGS